MIELAKRMVTPCKLYDYLVSGLIVHIGSANSKAVSCYSVCMKPCKTLGQLLTAL